MEVDRMELIRRLLPWLVAAAFSVAWGAAAALAEDGLQSISISGPESVHDGSSIQLKANAVIDGETSDITRSRTTRWSLSSRKHASISRGRIFARSVPNCGDQRVTVSVRHSKKGITRTATHDIAIVDDECSVSSSVLLSISIGGPTSVDAGSTTIFPVIATMSDGTTKTVTAILSEDSPHATFSGNKLTTSAVTDSQTVMIGAKYSENGVTRTVSKRITIAASGTQPAAPSSEGSHAGRFTSYDGAATCIACHRTQAVQVYNSNHYQWSGKFGAINDFCIYPDINTVGKLTNVYGTEVDGGCLKCHPGLGAKPTKTATPTDADLANIDCLVCHAPSYKRTVDPVTKAKFIPDETAMGMTILEAAADIRPTSRDTCLNCHARSGGGDNFKRGDIEEHHRNPATREFDVHMSPVALGGADMHCTRCHAVSAHKISGRGVDLRVEEGVKPDCVSCHTTTPPHKNSAINSTHVNRVHCTTCHIPAFAKSAPTDMFRDWSAFGELNTDTGLYDPARTMEANVVPRYSFWDGQSRFYTFGAAASPEANGNVLMAGPIATSPGASGAKIHPFKVHTALQPVDTATGRLLPLKMGRFYMEGDLVNAVPLGQDGVGWPRNAYGFQSTERWMGLFHEVAPKEQALGYNNSCTTCHGGGSTRMDLKSIGYAAKKPTSGLCGECHGSKSYSFGSVHPRHTNKGIDCSTCHDFARAR